MCGSVFWGILIILFGVSILINAIFGINLPLVKMFFAACLIYWGVSLLLPEHAGRSCTFFFKSYSKDDFDGDNYTVRFSTSTIDLNQLNQLTIPKTIKVVARFADVIVILPQNVPVRVKADTTFANSTMPDKQRNAEYINLHGASQPMLTVLIDSAFANIVVKE